MLARPVTYNYTLNTCMQIVGLPRSSKSVLTLLDGDLDKNIPLAMFFKVLDLVVNRRLYHDTDLSTETIWDVSTYIMLILIVMRELS